MNPSIIKYLSDLAAWQIEIAKWAKAQHDKALGVTTNDSGNNGPPPPPPTPPLVDGDGN